jgi:hypothetical protein
MVPLLDPADDKLIRDARQNVERSRIEIDIMMRQIASVSPLLERSRQLSKETRALLAKFSEAGLHTKSRVDLRAAEQELCQLWQSLRERPPC